MSVTDGEAVERENVRMRVIARDLHWMARRYCDGCMSYVTSLFNQHTRDLLEMGVRLEVTADADGTIWARDGMGRKFDHLTDEEAALGRPLEDWKRVPADQDEHLRLRADLATAQVRLRELEEENAALRTGQSEG